ncbi:hypothetical protein ABPG72_004963 [Tetrahymena utriculariae]
MQQEDYFISNSCMTLKETEIPMPQKSKITQDARHKQIKQKEKNQNVVKERLYSFSRQQHNDNNENDQEFDTEEAIKSAVNSLSSSTIKLAFSASTARQVDTIEKNQNNTQKYLELPNFSNDAQSLQIQQQMYDQYQQQEKMQIESSNSLSKTRPSIDSYFHFQETSLENISLEELTSQDASIINELSKKFNLNLKNSNQIEVIKRIQTTGIKNNQFMPKLDEIPQLNVDDLNLEKIKQNSIKKFDFQSSEISNIQESNTKEECLSYDEQQLQQNIQNHIFSSNIQTNECTLPQSQNCNLKKFTLENKKNSHNLAQIQQDLKIKVIKENSFISKKSSTPNSNECIPSDDQDYFSQSGMQQINNISERLKKFQEKRTLESDISLKERSSAISKPSLCTEDKQQDDFSNQKGCLDEEEEMSQDLNETKQNFIRRICDSSSLYWKQFTKEDDDYLLSFYEKIDKNNVNKNILSSFLKYILDNGDDVVVECLDSKQKDLNIIRKELKNFTRNKKLNNNTLNSFFNSQRYSEQFQYFLKFYAIDHFTKSKVKDKTSHYICVAFFLRCFFNNKLREKIVVYNKSKYFKSLHKNRYSAKQNQNENLNKSKLIN